MLEAQSSQNTIKYILEEYLFEIIYYKNVYIFKITNECFHFIRFFWKVWFSSFPNF